MEKARHAKCSSFMHGPFVAYCMRIAVKWVHERKVIYSLSRMMARSGKAWSVSQRLLAAVKSWYVTGRDGDFLQLTMVLNSGKERGTVQNDYSAFDLRHFESKGFQKVKLCANPSFKSKGYFSLFSWNDSLPHNNFLLVHMSICLST